MVAGLLVTIFFWGYQMRPILSIGLALAIGGGIALAAAPSYAQQVLPPGKPGRFHVIPHSDRNTIAAEKIQPSAAGGLLMWAHTVKVGATPYTFKMVGKNPFQAQANGVSTIKTVIVPLKFSFRNAGNVEVGTSDPTASDACSTMGSAKTMVLNSPVFKNLSNFHAGTGPNLGTGQYVSLFQRASFYSKTKSNGINPDYQVKLAPVSSPAFTVVVPVTDWGSATTTCGKEFVVQVDWMQNYIETTLFPMLVSAGYGPKDFPLFLIYNVTMYGTNLNDCCILGFHTAFGGQQQTYGISDYETSGYFDPAALSDTSVLTHEVAEWMDDPMGNNPTPLWGHIGQVGGCQNNLEVGDPLSGTIKPISMPNGFTYHVQDLAFWPWFYDAAAPLKVGGQTWFSMYGTFKVPAVEPCS